MSKTRIDYSLIEKEAYFLLFKMNKNINIEDIEELLEERDKGKDKKNKKEGSKNGIDYNLIEKEAEELLLNLKLKKYMSIEDLEKFLDKEKKDSKTGNMKIEGLSLKPKPPEFAMINNNKEERLILPKKQKDLGSDLLIFDLFDLIEKKCLHKFGLQDISIEDLKNNNINRALIIVNRKGEVTNIITNKSANKIFVDNLLLNTLKYGIDFKLKPKI